MNDCILKKTSKNDNSLEHENSPSDHELRRGVMLAAFRIH